MAFYGDTQIKMEFGTVTNINMENCPVAFILKIKIFLINYSYGQTGVKQTLLRLR